MGRITNQPPGNGTGTVIQSFTHSCYYTVHTKFLPPPPTCVCQLFLGTRAHKEFEASPEPPSTSATDRGNGGKVGGGGAAPSHSIHPTLGCKIFSSRARELAIRACGWGGVPVAPAAELEGIGRGAGLGDGKGLASRDGRLKEVFSSCGQAVIMVCTLFFSYLFTCTSAAACRVSVLCMCVFMYVYVY